MKDPKPKSETRKRTARATIRMTPSEHERVTQLAAQKGLSIGAYFRLRALGEIGERAQTRPRPIRKELAGVTAQLQKLSAEHNKIGSNINQLARVANSEGADEVMIDELKSALEAHEAATIEIAKMRGAILAKLGYDDR